MRAISEKANELSHYGVLGMKWGVRRTPAQRGKRAGDFGKEAGKFYKNQVKYPILTKRADRDSKKADTFGNRLRRATLWQNTRDLKDINQRVDEMIEQRKQKKISAIQKDIDSFKPFVETGILSKNGKVVLTSIDVNESIEGLKKLQEKYK